MDTGNLELIASGRFSHIYRDKDTVYKIGNPDDRDLLFNQFRLLSEIDDSHFPEVYQWIEEKDKCGFKMELLKGLHPNEIFSEKPHEEKEFERINEIMINLMDGLEYLHSKNIIHGDLKPQHIFIDKNNGVKIIDPGYNPDIITPSYASPEALTGNPSTASDIYSAGIIMYELITGERLFQGSLTQILQDKMEKEPEEPVTLNPGIPDELNDIIMRMTADDPEYRFRGIDEIWRVLAVTAKKKKLKPSIIHIFTGRKKEIEKVQKTVENTDKFNIILIKAKEGYGKSNFINRIKVDFIKKGIQTRQLTREELLNFHQEIKNEDKRVILIDEEYHCNDILNFISVNKKRFQFYPITFIISAEEEIHPEDNIEQIISTVELGRLKKKDIETIVNKNFPELKNRTHLVPLLNTVSKGVPWIIYSTLNQLIEDKIIYRESDRFIYIKEKEEEVTFTGKIKDNVKSEVRNLPSGETKVLENCSVFDNSIPSDFIEYIDTENPFSDLESLISRGFLKRHNGKIRFASNWLKKYLLDGLNKNKKKNIYERLIDSKLKIPETCFPLELELGYKERAINSMEKAIKKRVKERNYRDAIDILKKKISIKKIPEDLLLMARLFELIGNYKKALEVYEELRRDEPENMIYLLRTAINRGRTGNKKGAIKSLKKLVDDVEGRTREFIIYKIGRMLIDTGKIDEAENLLKEFRNSCDNRDDVLSELKFLELYLSFLKGEYEKVIESGIPLSKTERDPYIRGVILSIIGLSQKKQEKYEEALKYLKKRLKITRELGDKYNQGISLMNNGNVLIRLERYREAMEKLEKAHSIFKRGEMTENESDVLINLSILYIRLGLFDLMEEKLNDFFKRAGKIKPELLDKYSYLKTCTGDFERAREIIEKIKEKDERKYREALSFFKFLNEKWGEAEKLATEIIEREKVNKINFREYSCLLAEALYHQNKIEKAKEIIKPLSNELENLTSRYEKALILSHRGLINHSSEDFKKASEIYKELDLPFLTGKNHLRWGFMEFKREKIDSSVFHSRKAENIFENIKAKSYLMNTRKLLSRCAVKLSGKRKYTETYREISKLLSTIDSEDRFDQALRIIAESLNAERGAIIVGGKEGKYNIISSFNIDSATVNDAKKISSTISGRAAGGEVIITNNAGKDERFRELESVNRNRIRSILCVPITADDSIYGSLYLDSTIKKGIFIKEDKQFLQSMGRLLGILFSKGDYLQKLKSENLQLKKITESRQTFHSIVGKSLKMQEIYRTIEEVAPMNVHILITGETGTGKELVARTIHNMSNRKERPFITVDCNSLTETLLQSELFGHKKGSFTGALHDKEGMCEAANGGTLFLDEIGDAPSNVQAGLLHVTDRGEIRRIGETKWRKVDIRIISATNRNLHQLVMMKKFREDLYYRLNQITIELPPLREKKEDITLLADYYIKIFSEKKEKNIKGLTGKAIEHLKAYEWPGNIRELKNEMEVAVIRCEGKYISLKDLPDKFRKEKPEETSSEVKKTGITKELILETLNDVKWNKSKAAEKLNISRRHFYRLLKKYNIR